MFSYISLETIRFLFANKRDGFFARNIFDREVNDDNSNACVGRNMCIVFTAVH